LANCGKSTISSVANSTAKRVSAHTLQRIQLVPVNLGISLEI
jgi:DNA-binding LacI/PurR family transcriptional regulator